MFCRYCVQELLPREKVCCSRCRPAHNKKQKRAQECRRIARRRAEFILADRQAPLRNFECVDCKKTFIAHGRRGPIPLRCEVCNRRHACIRAAISQKLKRKSRPLVNLSCTECGREFSAKYKKAKYCSQKCVAARRKLPQNTCEECGVVVSTRTSRRCNACYRKHQTPLVATITCLHCKKAAKKRCWSSKLPKYCSRECFFAHIDACRPESERAKNREYAATRGSGSYRSRCKRYGGYFNSKVTRRAVFERDRFKCYLCRVKVSEELPARHDRKATLDHVVPLEKKGPHDWHNVACCCRKCNVSKRNNWDGRQVLDFSGGWEKVNG